MSFNDLRKLTPDHAKFGENIARMIRIIAKLLYDWSCAERTRRARFKTRNIQTVAPQEQEKPTRDAGELPGLGAIYFDKLVVCVCRLWDSLHVQKKVRNTAPFMLQRGFHGPGRTLHIDRSQDEQHNYAKNRDEYRRSKYAFFTEVVEKLKPGIGNTRLLFLLDTDSSNPRCKVYPQLDPNQWDAWTRGIIADGEDAIFLTPEELECVVVISGAMSKLTKDELRAIGTHCSAMETCKDIEYNLRAWQINMDKLQIYLPTREPQIVVHAYKLVTTSREILRKSKENETDYSNARFKICSSLTSYPALHNAFSGVQADSSLIWQDKRIQEYKANTPWLLTLSVYCRRGLAELGIGERLKRREVQESEDALTFLRNCIPEEAVSLCDYASLRNLSMQAWFDLLSRLTRRVLERMPVSLDYKKTGVP